MRFSFGIYIFCSFTVMYAYADVFRLKTRHGIRVVGAEAADATRWRISVDLNHKNRGAMVTAFVADREKYRKTDRYVPLARLSVFMINTRRVA